MLAPGLDHQRGRRRRVTFEIGRGSHLGGMNHFDLLHRPAVYEQLRRWLTIPLQARVASRGAVVIVVASSRRGRGWAGAIITLKPGRSALPPTLSNT